MFGGNYLRLSRITTKKRPETPEELRTLLTPKEQLELDDGSTDESEISDAFADEHRESFLSHSKGGKKLSKRQADLLTMDQFTDVFKDTISEIRTELQIGDNMMNESMDEINKILNEKRDAINPPQEIQERLEELLKDCEYVCSTSSQTSEELPATRKTSNVAFDTVSGVWRMLSVHNADKEKFQITSPTFNAYQRAEPHWLDRPAIPWKTLDFSKVKCEKWLSDQQ